jgi:hypothetical protein
VNPLFSRQGILELEPLIHILIDKLCARIQAYSGTGKPLNLGEAYTALTVDIITEYCFASPNGSLDDPNLGRDWHRALMDVSALVHVNAHFPWLVPLIRGTPEWVLKITNRQLLSFIEQTKARKMVCFTRGARGCQSSCLLVVADQCSSESEGRLSGYWRTARSRKARKRRADFHLTGRYSSISSIATCHRRRRVYSVCLMKRSPLWALVA